MDPRDIEVVSNVDYKAEKMHERLVKTRKERRLSREVVAKVIGCTPTTLYRWEKGQCDPNYHDLIRLSRLYNVSLEWLMINNGQKERELD